MTTDQQNNKLLRNISLGFLITGACAQPLGSLMPFFRESYGFSYDFSGLLLSAQSIGALVASIFMGILPLFFGRRRVILCTALWMTISYLIFVSGAGLSWMILLACFMNGIAKGGNLTFSNTMVSTLPSDVATRGYPMIHGSYALGAFVSPLVLILCMTLLPNIGWRVMAGGLSLLALFHLSLIFRTDIPSAPSRNGEKSAVDWSFFRNRRFWISSALLFFYISTEYAIVGWLVTYFQDTGILTASQAQLMSSFYWLTLFLGRLGISRIANRIPHTTVLIVDGLGMLFFFLLMLKSTTILPISIGILGLGLFMATLYPTSFALGSASVQGNDLGCSLIGLSGSLGGVITPILVGLVAQAVNIQAGMQVIFLCATLLVVTIGISYILTRHID